MWNTKRPKICRGIDSKNGQKLLELLSKFGQANITFHESRGTKELMSESSSDTSSIQNDQMSISDDESDDNCSVQSIQDTVSSNVSVINNSLEKDEIISSFAEEMWIICHRIRIIIQEIQNMIGHDQNILDFAHEKLLRIYDQSIALDNFETFDSHIRNSDQVGQSLAYSSTLKGLFNEAKLLLRSRTLMQKPINQTIKVASTSQKSFINPLFLSGGSIKKEQSQFKDEILFENDQIRIIAHQRRFQKQKVSSFWGIM